MIVFLPQDTGVEAHILKVCRSEPDRILLLAHPDPIKGDGLFKVAVAEARATVPHEAETHTLCLAVIGSDVTVEQSAFKPNRLTLKHPVL